MNNQPSIDDELTRIHDLQELLKDEFNVKLLLYLFAYHQLSLTKLTDLVSKSKPTVSRRIRQLIDLEVVQEVETKGRSKSYTLDMDFVQNRFLHYVTPESLEAMDPNSRKNLFSYIMDLSRNTATLLQQMLHLVQRYTTNFEEQKEGLIIDSPSTLQSWLMEYGVTMRMMPLDDATFWKFISSYGQFIQQFNQEHVNPKNQFQGEHLVWTVFLPTKKILP